jgi:hypothetical protein
MQFFNLLMKLIFYYDDLFVAGFILQWGCQRHQAKLQTRNLKAVAYLNKNAIVPKARVQVT